jgi:hypothetical protein
MFFKKGKKRKKKKKGVFIPPLTKVLLATFLACYIKGPCSLLALCPPPPWSLGSRPPKP